MKDEQRSKIFLEILQIDMIANEGDYRGMPTIVFETFFRTKMGERYFDFRAFRRGLTLLLIVRFAFLVGTSLSAGYPFHPLDGLLVLYLLFSLYHWNEIRGRANDPNQEMVHSEFIGYSRLFFIGNGFMYLLSFPLRLFTPKASNPDFIGMKGYYLTYLVIEPLLMVAIGAFGYFYWHSRLIALVAIIGAVIQCYTNYRKINHARQRRLDRKDTIIFGEMVNPTLKKINKKRQKPS